MLASSDRFLCLLREIAGDVRNRVRTSTPVLPDDVDFLTFAEEQTKLILTGIAISWEDTPSDEFLLGWCELCDKFDKWTKEAEEHDSFAFTAYQIDKVVQLCFYKTAESLVLRDVFINLTSLGSMLGIMYIGTNGYTSVPDFYKENTL